MHSALSARYLGSLWTWEGVVFTNPVVLPAQKYIQSSPLVPLKPLLVYTVFQPSSHLTAYPEKPLLAFGLWQELASMWGHVYIQKRCGYVMFHWTFSNQLSGFQRLSFWSWETRQRPVFLCMDKSWHCLNSSPEKEEGVVTTSLKGRQRLFLLPSLNKLIWYGVVSIIRGHFYCSEIILPLVLNHSQTHSINCWLSCSRGLFLESPWDSPEHIQTLRLVLAASLKEENQEIQPWFMIDEF